jgi:hypothetical protein
MVLVDAHWRRPSHLTHLLGMGNVLALFKNIGLKDEDFEHPMMGNIILLDEESPGRLILSELRVDKSNLQILAGR